MLKEGGIKMSKKDMFLPKAIRKQIIDVLLEMSFEEDTLHNNHMHVMLEGCPGLSNMSDKDLLLDLLTYLSK